MRSLPTLSLPAAALLSLVTACTPAATPTASADVLMQNGFEESTGWGGSPEQLSLTTAQAHGGKVAAVVSPEVPFGYTFARTLGELGLSPGAHRLELSAWVLRAASGSTAQLVVQVDASKTDQTKVYYKALPLIDAIPAFGEWKAVSLAVELPATAQAGNQLKVYLWNDKGTTPSYLDDVVLRRVAN